MNRGLVLFALALSPLAAQAGPWSGEVGLGYLATSGNSDTTSLNGKLLVDYVNGPWKNAFAASAINSSDDEGSTAERYLVTDKLDWSFSERDYVFGSVEWEKDLFGGVRERTSQTAGYGRHILTGPTHLLDAEIGTGARQIENADFTKEDDAIGRAFGKYQWKLSETSSFLQSLKLEAGSENTFSESVTELKLNVVGNLFAALSYTVKHNSDVPAGTEKTDTFSAVNLSYAFGKKL